MSEEKPPEGSNFSSSEGGFHPSLEIKLLRGEELRVETVQFTPKSLMSILVKPTGTAQMTTVVMRDNLGQVRYSSSSGGSDHEYITRLQNTRSFGKWQIDVSGVLADEETKFGMEIPFFVVKDIDHTVEEPVFSPEEYTLKSSEDRGEGDLVMETVTPGYLETTRRDSAEGSLLSEVIKEELSNREGTKPTLTLIQRKPASDVEEPEDDSEEDDSEKDEDIQEEIEDEGSIDGYEPEIDDPYYSEIDAEYDDDQSDYTDEGDDEGYTDNNDIEVDILEDEPHTKDALPEISTTGSQEVFDGDPEVEDTVSDDSLSVETQDEETEESTHADLIVEMEETLSTPVKQPVEQPVQESVEEPVQEELGTEIEQEVPILSLEEHVEQIEKELGKAKLGLLGELFIPIDEIDVFTLKELNMLNQAGIFYLHQLLLKSIDYLEEILPDQKVRLLWAHQLIREMTQHQDNAIWERYSSLGVIRDRSLFYSTEKTQTLKGIGTVIGGKLEEYEIKSVTDLANANIHDLLNSSGFSLRKIAEFIIMAQSLVYERVSFIESNPLGEIEIPEAIKNASQLDIINTIDLATLNKLYGLGINTVDKLFLTDAQELGVKLQISPITILIWIVEAQVYKFNRINIQARITIE